MPSNYNITHIPLDNVTRWNSTFYLIKIALKLKEVIIYIANNTLNKDFKKNILLDLEWEALSNLKDIFKVFVKPTIKLQGQTYTTLNLSLLYVYQIFNKLKDLRSAYKAKQRGNASLTYYNSFIEAI